MFAFKHKVTGKFVGFDYSSQDSEFSFSTTFDLVESEYADNVYASSNLVDLQKMCDPDYNVAWYNQTYSSPSVVCVDLTEYHIVNLLTGEIVQ